MSLQVWLPLNGDLKNYGLSDVQVTNNGATIDNNGKIGKCYSFNGSSNWIQISKPSKLTSIKNCSICFWVKSTSSIVALGGISHDSNSSSLAGLTMMGNSWQVSGNGSNWKYVNGGTVANTSIWHHVCCTIDDNIITTYLDGSVVTTSSLSSLGIITTELTSSNFLEIGCDHPGGNEFFTGLINDFRVYDHCLSLKEVKEIAKGLVLHYPLNKPMPNLIIGSDKYLQNKPYTHTSSAKDGINFMGSDLWMPCTPGKTYTFQFNTDGIWAPTHDTSGNGGGKTHFYLYLMEDSTNTGDFARPVDLTNNYKVNDNITGLGIWTYKIPTDKAYTKIMFRVDIHSNGSTSYTCHYWNFKAEEGNKATPWIPNESDPLYAAAGYASGIVYDCSGYQNNGTEVGTITGSSDTPRYRSSYYFDGIDSAIQVPYNATVFQTNFTINLWFKKTELGSKDYETLFGGPSGFEMDTRNSNSTTLSLYMASTRGGNAFSSFSFGEWYMVTMVNDGTNELYYINGELKKTIEKKSMPTGNYFIGAWSTSSKQNFKGYISDFRIYCTALSAADIKALYTDAGYVDKNGNFHAYEFVEI